nr:MFS transporter [Nocardioides panaciterrulae]
MTFTVTVVSTYVPVLVDQVTGPVVVGALIGGEGFFGIFMPAIVGGISDRRSRRVRDRMPLLVAFAAVTALAVAAVGLLAVLGTLSLWALALALAVLYAGYYSFLAPYWSLFPDLVPDEQSGRSVSAESTWRVTGVGLALIGGGLMMDLSPGLPFLVAAVLVVLVTALLLRGLRHRLDEPVHRDGDEGEEVLTNLGAIRRLLADADIRALCLANGLWNFALAALRAFVVLFFTAGLGRSSTFVSTVIFPLVAVGIAVAAPLSGWAADRFGHVRLLGASLLVYGVLMVVPGLTQQTWVVALIPLVAAGAATVMTLPLSVLMRLLPEDRHGAASGLFGLSRGIGATLGPVVAGAAIVLLGPVLPSTHGYAAMWFVCSAALVASLPLLWRLRHDDRL